MRLRELEARLVKLERDPSNNRLSRLSDEDLEAMCQQTLADLIAHSGSFAAVVAEMEASDEPEIREGARLVALRHGPRFGYTAPAAVQ